MEIIWKKEYEIGNFEIDSQHHVFVKTIQKIHMAVGNDRSDKHIERLVSEVHKYAEYHFCSEENIMHEIDYPDIEDHKKEHQDLIEELSNLVWQFDFQQRDTSSLIEFLVKWFKNHTIIYDKKLSKYINSHQ